jgi:sortase (surface protein transpeptidase)
LLLLCVVRLIFIPFQTFTVHKLIRERERRAKSERRKREKSEERKRKREREESQREKKTGKKSER